MRKLLQFIWMVLVLIIVALLSALTAMRLAIHGREVAMPDLLAKTPAEARQLAEDTGLSLQVEREYYSSTIPEGRVVSQTPVAGTLIRRGWEAHVALSLGPQRVVIPKVVGESDRAAEITIARRGLNLGSTATLEVAGAVAGDVVAQNPQPNATDVSAPKISLLIAQSPQPQAFVMPNLLGQPVGSAANAAKAAGLSIITVASPPTSGVPNQPPVIAASPVAANNSTAQPSPPAPSPAPPANIVAAQEPAPGARIQTGSMVRLTVK